MFGPSSRAQKTRMLQCSLSKTGVRRADALIFKQSFTAVAACRVHLGAFAPKTTVFGAVQKGKEDDVHIVERKDRAGRRPLARAVLFACVWRLKRLNIQSKIV